MCNSSLVDGGAAKVCDLKELGPSRRAAVVRRGVQAAAGEGGKVFTELCRWGGIVLHSKDD